MKTCLADLELLHAGRRIENAGKVVGASLLFIVANSSINGNGFFML
jgi:hypothetical protein